MTTGKVCKQINILQLKKNQLNWNELILIAHISTDATSKLKTCVTRKYIQLFQVVHSKLAKNYVLFEWEKWNSVLLCVQHLLQHLAFRMAEQCQRLLMILLSIQLGQNEGKTILRQNWEFSSKKEGEIFISRFKDKGGIWRKESGLPFEWITHSLSCC